MIKISKFWFFIICLIVIVLLFGDKQFEYKPRNENKHDWSKWSLWREIEPPDTRIRILWIDQDYVPFVNAGSEICTHTINKFLISKPYKWDIWVASPGYPNRTYNGIRCFNLHDTNTFLNVLKTTHQIHSHSYAYRDKLIYMSRITGIPFVAWIHSNGYVTEMNKTNKLWNDPRCNGAIWSAFNSNSLYESIGFPIENANVFIPIVDYRAYTLNNHQPKYVTLSNVNYNKGGKILIELAKACPNIEFMGVIGGYRAQIMDETLPNLHYVPHTENILEVYEKTWIQIMPSKDETWGRTAVEAMSSGIPLIVSPTPGLRECCQDAAIYIDRSDIDTWVETLQKLKSDREFYNMRSKLSLARARALDPRPVCNNIDEWLEKKVQNSRVPNCRQLSIVEKNLIFR